MSPDPTAQCALPTPDSFEFFQAWEKKINFKNEVTLKRSSPSSDVIQNEADRINAAWNIHEDGSLEHIYTIYRQHRFCSQCQRVIPFFLWMLL